MKPSNNDPVKIICNKHNSACHTAIVKFGWLVNFILYMTIALHSN